MWGMGMNVAGHVEMKQPQPRLRGRATWERAAPWKQVLPSSPRVKDSSVLTSGCSGLTEADGGPH